jgi:hypothetical protein
MVINTDNLVSITEANQNFSRVARMVDENGAAVILKNNVPRYVLMEFSQTRHGLFLFCRKQRSTFAVLRRFFQESKAVPKVKAK